MARRAASLTKLVEEINAAWPDRQKQTDGWIADNKHGSTSKHQPQNSLDGQTVRAQDITQSLPVLDTNWLADQIAVNIREGREKRVLGIGSWNIHTKSERWFSQRSGIYGWLDRDLHGASHEGHMHIEIINEWWAYDDTSSWNLNVLTIPRPTPEPLKVPKMILIKTERAIYTSDGTSYVAGGLQPQNLGMKFVAAGVPLVEMSGVEMQANFARVEPAKR